MIKKIIKISLLAKANQRTSANKKSLQALTNQAFRQCDFDGDSALSWDEIQECEDSFCHMLTIPCPTKRNFDFYDINRNGILTIKEYKRRSR